MKKIFIIEDEAKIIDLIKVYLEKEDFEVRFETNGKLGLEKVLTYSPDVLILDLMLPDLMGEEIIKEIRKKSNMHILVLSAKVTEESVLNAFKLGADDYIRKPFSPKELTSKINAITRKNQTGIQIDDLKKEVHVNGVNIELTKNEFSILKLLSENPNMVFEREKIIDILFQDYEAYDRTIDAYIKNIRKKISPQIIKTVHGIGYRMGDKDEI